MQRSISAYEPSRSEGQRTESLGRHDHHKAWLCCRCRRCLPGTHARLCPTIIMFGVHRLCLPSQTFQGGSPSRYLACRQHDSCFSVTSPELLLTLTHINPCPWDLVCDNSGHYHIRNWDISTQLSSISCISEDEEMVIGS